MKTLCIPVFSCLALLGALAATGCSDSDPDMPSPEVEDGTDQSSTLDTRNDTTGPVNNNTDTTATGAANQGGGAATQSNRNDTLLAQEGAGQATPTQATAYLEPASSSDVSGTVTFTQQEGGIQIQASVEGLSSGKYGFHVHENGDCSAPDASSAGGHFNPNNTQHGAPSVGPDERHVGDLGNLLVDGQGNAEYQRVDPVISFEGEHSILGKAVVIHRGEDDLESQPSGDAGERIACGIIEPTPENGQRV